jgi:hypothetical protein
MSRRPLLTTSLLMIFTFVLAVFLLLPGYSSAASEKEPLITVMNPAVREILAPRVDLPPRLTTLEGKTIYLVDMNYEGIDGTPVMGEIQAWFTKNMPNVKTVLRVKKGNYIEDDPGLWKEIVDNKGAGVIMGVAG